MSKRKPKPKRSRTKATKTKATRARATKKVAKKKGGPAPARRAKRRGRKRTTATRRGKEGAEDQGQTIGLLREVLEHHETGPAASAGDLDADWQRAQSSGEEAAGGSVSTPDQDRDAGGPGPALLGARATGAGQGEQAGRALTGYTFPQRHTLFDCVREGWMIAGTGNRAGGKSGLRRAGCWLTARGGDPMDSATESKPPPSRAVRVKR